MRNPESKLDSDHLVVIILKCQMNKFNYGFTVISAPRSYRGSFDHKERVIKLLMLFQINTCIEPRSKDLLEPTKVSF